MTGPARRSGLDLRVAIVAAVMLLLALGGAAAWAYTTNADLAATRATVGSMSDDLASVASKLDAIEAELATAAAALDEAEKAVTANEARIRTLTFQAGRKAECIKAQGANLAEIRRILALERDNFGRTTSTSAWAKAHAASQRAIDLAIADLYKAYTNAADGKYATANAWLDKSNAQIRVSNSQLDAMDEEIDAINKASDAINAANDAFENTLDATVSTCGG